jgi:hypothetical protein
VWNPQIVDVNTLRYSILLANSLPSFAFGEVALYSDTTLLGVAVNAVMLNKIGPVSGSSGQTFKLDFFIGNAPGQQYAVGDVIGDQRAFARLPVPDLLKPPALNETNAYVIYGIGENDIPYFAFSDPTGKWSFSSKPSIYITGTISDVGTYGLQSFDITGSYPGPVTDLVLQFVSGTTRGYCRQVSSMVTDGIVWTTPMTYLPSVGDSFIILGPQVSSGGTITATADDYAAFSFNGSALVVPQTFGHYVNTFESGTSTRLSHTSLTSAHYNGGGNTALGYSSLAQISVGNNNTAVGDQAMRDTGGGDNNTVVGAQSLSSDASGVSGNSTLGYNTLSWLTQGNNNVAIGHSALATAGSLIDNVAVGAFSLTNLLGQGAGAGNGHRNVAVGAYSLTGSTIGDDNTAIGHSAAYSSTSGVRNTAVGGKAMYSVTVGYNNTAVGYYAGQNLTTGTNNTFLGYNALALTGTASNTITLGNSAITTLRCQVTTITALSDFRDKTDIMPLQQGIDFVMGLKPVSFTWNTRDGSKVGIKDSGFIAQDLKQSQDEVGAQDILKLVCEDDPEHLEASAGRLLPVLVKAIQDLTNQVNSLKAELAILKGA